MGQEVIKLNSRNQRGAALLLFVVGIFLVSATIYAVNLFIPAKRGANQIQTTVENFRAIQDAAIAYAAVYGHLPCPANPAVPNDGVSDPSTPSAICNTPGGVVPWATLGIAPEVVLDGWNRRISFRVFSGVTGLTQPGGASMVNCDTTDPAPDPLVGHLCNAAYSNTNTQFLAGKGLNVNDAGNIVPGVAFILISHGESGNGAYLPSGARVQMPGSVEEIANAGVGGTFTMRPHSAPGIDPLDVAHFDDSVAWMTISELANKSGLSSRDWPE